MFKNLTKKDIIIRSIFLLCEGVLSFFFIRRLFFGIDVSDEVFNICESYRLANGNRFLVDVWDYYQTGDIFLTPFIWIYVTINGSTEGIVLACRLFYLLINIGVGVVAYKLLKDYFRNFYSRIAVSLAIVFYAPFSLYYLWYDTAGQLFFLLGILFLLKAYKNPEIRWNILAGFFHACMVIAYPSAIVVIAVEVICYLIVCIKNKRKKYIGIYLLGGIIPILGLVIYGLIVKFDFYLFNNPVSNVNQTAETEGVATGFQIENFSQLFGRGADGVVDKLLTSLRSIFGIFFSGRILLLIIFGILGLFVLYIMRKRGMRRLLAVFYLLLLVLVIVLSIKFSDEYNRAVIFAYAFCMILLIGGFIIYPHLIKENIIILLVVAIPALSFVPIMSITTAHGGNKAIMGMWVLCLFAIGIYLENMPDILGRIKDIVIPGFIAGFLMIVVYLFYGQFFQEACQYSDCTIKVESGIYKGLYASKEDEEHLDIEKEIVSLVGGEDAKVAIFDDRAAYKFLALNCRISACSVLDSMKFDKSYFSYTAIKTYWERFGYADLLLINKSEGWYIEQEIYDASGCNYVKDKESEHYILFRNMVD